MDSPRCFKRSFGILLQVDVNDPDACCESHILPYDSVTVEGAVVAFDMLDWYCVLKIFPTPIHNLHQPEVLIQDQLGSMES